MNKKNCVEIQLVTKLFAATIIAPYKKVMSVSVLRHVKIYFRSGRNQNNFLFEFENVYKASHTQQRQREIFDLKKTLRNA